VAAVGSFLDARHQGGQWLVRVEDLDTPRVVPGCADEILRTLEACGLTWDGTVEYQSRRTPLYESALAALQEKGLTFACSCSRRELADETGYPGTCRTGPVRPGPSATRFRVDETATARFEDRIQGSCHYPLGQLGDVIVRRRNGLFAYQLAVVVDDAAQGITDIVRGADLLESTAWQLALGQALGLGKPTHAHLPLIVEPDGSKLAKSRRSLPLDPRRPGELIAMALTFLDHTPPLELAGEGPNPLLRWASASWSVPRLSRIRTIRAPR
jgi:glutamyl-Q tRNA(Asp) synthetase